MGTIAPYVELLAAANEGRIELFSQTDGWVRTRRDLRLPLEVETNPPGWAIPLWVLFPGDVMMRSMLTHQLRLGQHYRVRDKGADHAHA